MTAKVIYHEGRLKKPPFFSASAVVLRVFDGWLIVRHGDNPRVILLEETSMRVMISSLSLSANINPSRKSCCSERKLAVSLSILSRSCGDTANNVCAATFLLPPPSPLKITIAIAPARTNLRCAGKRCF